MTTPSLQHTDAPWDDAQAVERAGLSRQSTVAALVPHRGCEQWLGDCLESLVQQTRPLDAVVVIDDGSAAPPVDIVQRFPEVTLLASSDNVGPYRLLQQVISDTMYDGYLFQDADDWSARDRLGVLLDEAERTGAELVGCQEILIDCATANVETSQYPIDVNQELTTKPAAFALAHHTSVVSRDLMTRIGGFATGLRFGADSELLPRAVRAAQVRNVARYCYFRRRRDGSLTTDAATGMQSLARRDVADMVQMRALTDRAAYSRGELVSLQPTTVADQVSLAHVLGPELRQVAGDAMRSGTSWSELLATDDGARG